MKMDIQEVATRRGTRYLLFINGLVQGIFEFWTLAALSAWEKGCDELRVLGNPPTKSKK